MNIDRKQFLFLTAAICAGCKSLDGGGSAPAGQTRVVDAGSAEAYAADGIHAGFQSQGFFVVRKGASLFAISSYCTHRKCKLTPETDHSFYCDCHGSTFDPDGKVTHGPAFQNLPVFPSTRNAAGHLMVTVQG
jgi:Rieske Fe-S protein